MSRNASAASPVSVTEYPTPAHYAPDETANAVFIFRDEHRCALISARRRRARGSAFSDDFE
jgi:hypothetical protein